jgi:hypothetical protein
MSEDTSTPIPENPAEDPDAAWAEPENDDLGLTDRQDSIDGAGFELEGEPTPGSDNDGPEAGYTPPSGTQGS